MTNWLMMLSWKISRAVLRLLQDTTGVRPLDTDELKTLNRLLDDDQRKR